MTKEKLKHYVPGGKCRCYASSESDCGCGVDWTPREVYQLRAANSILRSAMYEIQDVSKDCETRGIAEEALNESAIDG